MTVSDLMKAMAEAGAPFEAILIAVRAIEAKDAEIAARDAQAAEKKAKDAARKRSVRGTSEENPRNVHGNGADVSADIPAGDPLPLPPNDLISNPPTPTPENNSCEREDADAHVVDWLAWWDKNPFPRPRFASASLWASLKKNRKTKRLANTVAAWTKLLVDVDAYAARLRWPPGKVLEACVERGWGAIHETNEMKAILNANGNGGHQRSARQSHGGGRDNRDGFKRHLDDIIDQAERSAAGGDGGFGQLALGGPDTL